MNKHNIAIIGAGAAGCFCAIEIKRRLPMAEVHVFEAATKALAKVAVTGGGRCNLTNSFAHYKDERGRLTNLQLAYPRGDKLMRKLFGAFGPEETYEWFEREGVKLLVQDDECVFPVSQDAMEIVNTLLTLMHNLGVHLHLHSRITDIQEVMSAHDAVIVTTGGSPKASGLNFLDSLHLDIIPPVPSLFTFNIAGEQNQRLMGTVVEHVSVSLAGTRHRAEGPLLWTHWGMSGPAILKLSSYAARHLADNDYKGTLIVNWLGDKKEDDAHQMLESMMCANSQKVVTNVYPEIFTQKHWTEILQACSIPLTQRWGALNKTHISRLASALTAQSFTITGRCHYKEEFVTCGGVSLSEISAKTMECKKHPGLYFAGEVLDVDAITGGFNLQAAWSMAYRIAESVEPCEESQGTVS